MAKPTKISWQISKAIYDWASETDYIPGVNIELPTEDNRYDMSMIVPAYMKLKAKDPLIIQFIYSQDADVMKPLCARDMIPATGYTASYIGVSPPGWVFTTAPLHDVVQIALLNWINDTWEIGKMGRPCRFGTLSWDNTMGVCGIKPSQLYADTLTNVDYVSAEVAPPRTMDFSTYITRMKNQDLDYIWLPMISAASFSAIKTAIELGMSPTKFILSPTTIWQFEVAQRTLAKESLEGMLNFSGYYHYSDKTQGMELTTKLWKERYPDQPLTPAAIGLTAGASPAYVIVEALRMAIADVGVDKLDSVAVYRALQKIKDFDNGTQLPITFGPDRRDGNRSVTMYKYQDGEFRLLSDKAHEGAPYPWDLLGEAK